MISRFLTRRLAEAVRRLFPTAPCSLPGFSRFLASPCREQAAGWLPDGSRHCFAERPRWTLRARGVTLSAGRVRAREAMRADQAGDGRNLAGAAHFDDQQRR